MGPRDAAARGDAEVPATAAEYLAGTPRLQAWTGRSSIETRLTVARDGGYTRKTYDPNMYERQMFYFNVIVREWGSYDHGVPLDLVPGLDYCYGCALEAHIWKKYLGPSSTPAKVATLFNRTAKAISRALDRPAHGVDPTLAMPERRARILGRKYEDVDR